jgi:hypothetical protein
MLSDIGAKLATSSKAIAALIAGTVVMFLTKNNIIISDELNDAIEVAIGAIIIAVSVWLAPKNKP